MRVSVGVAIWPRHGAELHALVEAADQAMYQAKRDGETWHVAERGHARLPPQSRACLTI